MVHSGGLCSPSAANLHPSEGHPPYRLQHFSSNSRSAIPLPPEMLVMALHPLLRLKLGEAFSNPVKVVLGQFLVALCIPWLWYRKVALALLLLPHRSPCIICTASHSPLFLCVLFPQLGTLQVNLSYLKSIPTEQPSTTAKKSQM